MRLEPQGLPDLARGVRAGTVDDQLDRVQVAQALLDGWDPSRFTKVMPRDYKRVLEVMREAQESGADADEMVMAAVKR